MIITVSQSAQLNYYIKGGACEYRGTVGKVSPFQEIVMHNGETEFVGTYQFSKWVNYIPFRYCFGTPNLTKGFRLQKNGKNFGTVVFSQHGFMKSFYVIALDSGGILHCYQVAKGTSEYVCVYLEDQQIALIETNLTVTDYIYTHTLYLLDEHSGFSDVLSWFALYYANFHFAKRAVTQEGASLNLSINKGTVREECWTFSKYNCKYDPQWQEKYFPKESIFDKLKS
ncbi:MAG: hypothetical protein IJW92_09865 [Clostridia bacterium]|nr:hypothetical protein [Clostridia bacterium]